MEEKERRFFDRELSWLSFNGRVLQEAADGRVPLIERLRFLAIFSSNLDEFFRVRVATLRTLVRLPSESVEKLKFNPHRLLLEILRRVDRQQREFGRIFRDILPALREEGIYLHETGEVPPEADYFVTKYFLDYVAPHIHPVILEHYPEPPFLKNGGLYLVVPLWPRTEFDSLFVRDPALGLVEIPSDHVPRFVQVHRDDTARHVMFLDDIIRANLKHVFPMNDSDEAYSIKMTRDAQLYIEDEYSGNLVETVRNALARRDTGVPTRFLFDQRMPYTIAVRLKQRLGLEDEDLVPGGFYHNFSDFFGFPDYGREDLQFQPMPPLPHPRIRKARRVLDRAKTDDLLFHFPYQSFEPVTRFLFEDAEDPDVQRISATLYRVAPRSKIVEGLTRAATTGKDVKAFVEVKARFDEEPNLQWAKVMERAGVRVVYSLPGLKVHGKLLLVEAADFSIAYLGTGNLNEKTAKIYCDHGMLTADHRITSDVERVFSLLEDPSSTIQFDHLLVAPNSMRKTFKRLVEREIEHAKAGRKAGMILKMNSLEDRGMIKLLYRASQAGVAIHLVVRGICCLIPGIPGLSENIQVTSIVGRFLEHARVYVFKNDGDDEIFLASADWMKRNLSRRIEVAWPIYDGNLKREILDLLNLQIADNSKARHIDAQQQNRYVEAQGQSPVAAQTDTYQLLKEGSEL